MPATHVVKAGEHLGSIARGFGYEGFSAIWEHPANAALKALRKDPMQLAPGDEVFIPDRVQLIFKRATATTHDFRINVDTLSLTLRFVQFDGKPHANAPIVIKVEAPETDGASVQDEQALKLDGDGKISFDVASHVVAGVVELDGVTYPLEIGGLDPIETETGVAQRLANLGYLVLSDSDVDPVLLRLAIEDFQADNAQPTTGKSEDARAKLAEIYGA